ncbi:MAG TPA: ImmA/IrrE family metallo-endopeptidase [Alphaproteobacteria bacterium]|nr:ImmA/IrrE family metallo-endopeptidase [Alphaproteobacteria bacterium]
MTQQGSPRSPKSVEDIRAEVVKLLARHNVSQAPVDVEKIARKENIDVKYSPFEGDTMSGALYRMDDTAIIAVNSLNHPNRRRFTIAHELGHFVLHNEALHVDRSFSIKHRDATSSLAIDPEEIEANRFAAELLMPYDLICADLKLAQEFDFETDDAIAQLASKYRVSEQAMIFRLNTVLATFTK